MFAFQRFDGGLQTGLALGEHVFWKGPGQLEVDQFSQLSLIVGQ